MNENLNATGQNGSVEQCCTQKPEISKNAYSKTDILFSPIYFVLGYFFVRLIFNREPSVFMDLTPVFTLVYAICVLSYAHFKSVKPSRESWFWLAVMFLIAVPFSFYTMFDLLQFLSLMAVAAYWTMSVGTAYVNGEGSSSWLFYDLVNCLLFLPFSRFGAIFKSFIRIFKLKLSDIKKSGSVILGLALAMLSLLFIFPLLVRSDINLAAAMHGFFSYFNWNISSFLLNLFFWFIPSVLVACYLFSLSFTSFTKGEGFHYSLEDKNQNLQQDREKLRIATKTTICVFLYIICGVYLLFIVLQAGYLFSAFFGKLFGNMTYAQYARNGFFELCQVCAINIFLLILSNLILRKEDGEKAKKPYLALCFISILLLITATAKMVMYIAAYGLTVKRVLATAFLLWLVIVFVLCIVRCFKAFNLTKCCLVCGAILFCSLCVFNVESLTKSYNHSFGFDKDETNFTQSLDNSSIEP